MVGVTGSGGRRGKSRAHRLRGFGDLRRTIVYDHDDCRDHDDDGGGAASLSCVQGLSSLSSLSTPRDLGKSWSCLVCLLPLSLCTTVIVHTVLFTTLATVGKCEAHKTKPRICLSSFDNEKGQETLLTHA